MDSNNRLNEPYPMLQMEQAGNTKERILLAAMHLFTQRGVAAVSVRDIAEQVNLRPASIYNHFESKEVLWQAILDRTKELYLLYFERLDRAIAESSSWREVLDAMFAELFTIVDIFTYYSFSMVQAEQFWDDKAYRLYKEIFFEYSIDFITEKFDMCIEKGWARKFNTRFIATIYMQHVLMGIVMRTHKDSGRDIPYDVDKQLRNMYDFLYETGALE